MEFCKITAIIPDSHLKAVEKRLQDVGVKGVSVSRVKGYGEYANFGVSDWLSPHARIEVFAPREDSPRIVGAIVESAHSGMAGDGIVAVLPVDSIYRIRTRRMAQRDEI